MGVTSHGENFNLSDGYSSWSDEILVYLLCDSKSLSDALSY